MGGINKVILVGRLGQDPESQDVNNTLATKFSLATSESWTDKNTGQKKEKTQWTNIKLWGKLAEIAQTYLRKGHQVYLEGKLETRQYKDKTGQVKYITEVVLQGFGDTLEMLDKKDSNDQRAPVSQAAPKQSEPQARPQGDRGQTIPGEEFDDDIPF